MVNNTTTARNALKITEEVISSATHGLGAVLGIIGLVLGLLTLAAPTAFTVSFVLYGICLITLMSVSALYHALLFTRAKGIFQVLDHSGIFLLIAGSYTPFIITLYGGWAQAIFLALVWSLATAGIVFKATLPSVMNRFGAGVYIALGWLGLIFVPKLHALPGRVMWLVVIGGLLYTIGASLLAIKKPFVHVAWHIFVVAAACVHYFAITKLV